MLVCRPVDLFEHLLQALLRLRFGFLEGAVLIRFDYIDLHCVLQNGGSRLQLVKPMLPDGSVDRHG